MECWLWERLCMEWGGIWELSKLFTQFCCKLKPSLNAGALRRGAKDLIRHFCKDKQIPNKHMKRCSTSLSSVQFSHSVVSDSLRPHESQHASPPCPSPTPRVYLNSCPSSPWCHPAISSSVVPFSSWPQPLQASESFPMNQLFAWDGQSTGVSALAGLISFRMYWLDLLAVQGTLKSLLQHHSSKASIIRHY